MPNFLTGIGPALQLKLLMLALILMYVFRLIKPWRLAQKSQSWIQVVATVDSSSIDRDQQFYYQPKIVYRYNVNGQPYINDVYAFMGTVSTSKKHAVATALSHPQGSEIVVLVDPIKPENAVVVPGIHWTQYANVGLVIAMLLGIAFLPDILNFIFPGCQPKCDS